MHMQTSAGVRPDDILAALDGNVSRVQRSPLYNVSQLAVAVAMVVLPLVYLALIAAVGFMVFKHATVNAGPIFETSNGRTIVIVYFGPLVIGVTVVFFMVKPLFARPPKAPPPYVADPEEQKLLFAFVARLSELLGAPNPKEIHLDSNVNASASFRRGMSSMAGSDLVLTIGMPLVEGMSLRQLTGVLSHELGHFSQGAGMRLSYVIRTVSHWFARVVYERDGFDQSLEQASEKGGHWLFMIIIWGARGCVWLTRRVLWALMWVGVVLSSALLRQMEYDADRYEARVAGSGEFAATAQRLAVLGVGQHIAMNDLQRYWRERKLPDQFARLTTVNAEMLGASSREQIRERQLERKTGTLDTHPSDADRIRSVEKENSAGIMELDLPATSLIAEYDDVARAVSRTYYEGMLGGRLEASNLVPTDRFLSDREAMGQRYETVNRFFQGHAGGREPVFLSVGRVDSAGDQEALRSALAGTRDGLVSDFPVSLAQQQELLRNRLYHGLQLLRDPEVVSRAAEKDEAIDLDDVERKVEFLHELEQRFQQVLWIRAKFEVLVNDLQRLQSRQQDERLVKDVQSLVADCRGGLVSLAGSLNGLPYPYEHAQPDCDCALYATPHVPNQEDIGGVIHATEHCLNCLYELHMRVLGDLAVAAERAERLAGLADLPAPASEGDSSR